MSKPLTQSLQILSVWFMAIRTGIGAFTPEGQEAFQAALDRAALDADALEGALALYRPQEIVLAAIKSGKVAVLPTTRAIRAIYHDALLDDEPIEIPFGDGA